MKLERSVTEKNREVIELLMKHPITKKITAPVAAELLGMSETEFRELARDLSIVAKEIASNQKGFWWAYEPEDMDPGIKFLMDKFSGMLARIKGAKAAKRKLERNRAVPRNRTYQLDLEDMNVTAQSNQ